jgi:flavin-dependent dehydrogenase
MREIRIAGGGLAGLTLGILLQKKGVPVILSEAGSYPRHRVCGEFISGHGAEIYQQLISENSPQSPPALSVSTVRFFKSGSSTRAYRLPKPAISVSRYHLDSTLASAFVAAGGQLREKTRWTEPFAVEGCVRATGRCPNPKSRLIGLKIHIHDLPLSADLELHFKRQAYVGLSRLPGGEVNLCGLFRIGNDSPISLKNLKSFVSSSLSSPTRENFQNCKLDEASFCAVAGLSLRPQPLGSTNECRIGDSISLIAPLTGNGMSLAFESGHCASAILERYSKGFISWNEAQAFLSQECENRFGQRLRCADFLQKCAFTTPGQWILMSCLRTVPGLFNPLFRATRG